ncbi:unnamed protein product [Rotaria socialis]|uniref:Uncharacterized protein n=1 Tax=Rotaria socialis TaxID=392032 RepID=A0A820VHG7_9BILA|nr:unnamed protein product [Rotaria socialis]
MLHEDLATMPRYAEKRTIELLLHFERALLGDPMGSQRETDILGPGDTGNIILYDAPGFGDTASPEVSIANGVGIVEALKGCKNVKILALSSFKALGDRAQGIQELAHILNKMIKNKEDRLDAIQYTFTKYPSTTDIHAHIPVRQTI